MTKKEVLRKIKEATDAINGYNKPTYLFSRENVDQEITEAANELFSKRAFILDSSGNSCPTCGGSGRV